MIFMLNLIATVALLSPLFVILVSLMYERRQRRLTEEELEAKFQAAISVPITPPSGLQPWTQWELENLGISETERAIQDIDRAIRAVEWERIREAEGARGIVIVTNGHPSLPPDHKSADDATHLYAWGKADPIR